MNLTALLLRLQTIEIELDDNTKRAQEIDAALATDPHLDSARAANDAAQKRLATLRAQLHDRELATQALETKLKEIEARLYGGRVTNLKELDSLEKDLQMHKRQRSALDDDVLGLMEQVEQAQRHAEQAAHARAQAEAARASALEQLTRERDALAARFAELTATREQTRVALNADALKRYAQLRQTKASRAVAPLKRDACSACGVTVPSALLQRVREGNELVLCSGCGRILATE